MSKRIRLLTILMLFMALLVTGTLAWAETWKISFNGYPGTMELNGSQNSYTGRFNLHGNWEDMLDLRVFRNAIFFRRAAADQKYLGVMEDGRMLGIFSQGGAGSYPWSAEKIVAATQIPASSYPVPDNTPPAPLEPAAATSDGAEKLILKLESLGAVYNNPSKRPVFTIDRPTRITKVWTYHWNKGQGASPGTISIRNTGTGEMLGPWTVAATYHMFDSKPGATWPAQGDGPPWLYWTARPNATLSPGSYEVFDSDPATWSTNAEMGNKGVSWVYGVQQDSAAQADTAYPVASTNNAAGYGTPVTIYWHMADDADVYLNGKPLRDYSPSFRTRGDEAPRPAFSAKTVIKDGDIITVGGRRGGSYGLMLIAVDETGRVVFKTDSESWSVYEPGERNDWFEPSVAAAAGRRAVTVQPNPWYPQKTLNSQYRNVALSIWSEPSNRFAYLVGTVRMQ